MRKYLILIILSMSIIFNVNALAYVNYAEITVAPKVLHFSITNPSNSITGYNNGVILTQIPNLTYNLSGVETGEDKPTIYETFYKIDSNPQPLPTPLAAGIYKLSVYNNNPNVIISQIMIELDSTENINLSHFDKHLIYPNSVWTYEFNVPVTIPVPTNRVSPNAPPFVAINITKVSTPADLIKDLTTAGQLDYIGNSKFVTELTKEINEIEAEKAKGKVDDGLTPAQKAKKEYTELLKEITEKYNKPEGDEFVKQEAYSVLKEDIEYIISHIQ